VPDSWQDVVAMARWVRLLSFRIWCSWGLGALEDLFAADTAAAAAAGAGHAGVFGQLK